MAKSFLVVHTAHIFRAWTTPLQSEAKVQEAKGIRRRSSVVVGASLLAVGKCMVIYAYDHSDYLVTTGYRGLSSPPPPHS